MPCPPPPPIGKRQDPDLLLIDKLPQPFRLVQNELLRIVNDAVEIGHRNQMEEEERSKQPSTTAERTVGPLVEPADQLGNTALLGASWNCDRPFYTRPSGDVIEVCEDGSVATLQRPDELGEGETALCVAATRRDVDGLEIVMMLSSNSMVFMWHRQAEAKLEDPAPPEEGDEPAEFGPTLPIMELRVAVSVTPPEEAGFTQCDISKDGSTLVVYNEQMVVAYRNPMSFDQGSEVVTGELEQITSAPAPAGGSAVPFVRLISSSKPRDMSNEVLEHWVSSMLIVWNGTNVLEEHTLLAQLPGEFVSEENAEEPEPVKHVRRWLHTATVTSCDMSKDQTTLAIALIDGCTVLWDIVTGCILYVLQLHIGPVKYVRLGPDHVVTVGEEDKKLRSYNLHTGEKLIEVDVPPCGIDGLYCLQEVPLALAVTSWGLKLFDVNSGDVFADLSTVSPEVIPDMDQPGMHSGESYLTVMATRPPDPPAPPEDGEEEAPPEDVDDTPWRVPIQIESTRIIAAYQEYKAEARYQTEMTEEHMEDEMLGATNEDLPQGLAQTAMGARSRGNTLHSTAPPDLSGTVRKGTYGVHSVPGSGRASRVITPASQMNSNFPGAQTFAPSDPSPFDLSEHESRNFDLIGRVREHNHSRHGERRLREIRIKKRLVSLLDNMKAAEAN